MNTRKYKIQYFFAVMLLVFLFILSSIGGGVGVAYAATSSEEYSGVLDDLSKDKTFDFNAYKNDANDNSLQVIQLAESKDGELLLYVYQPSAAVRKLTATYVNMALRDSVEETSLYHLTLLSREGVLQKYRVDGVTVLDTPRHYYTITSIYRDWIKGIDSSTGNDNTITSVSFAVGQKWCVYRVTGHTYYSMNEFEVISVTDKYCSTLRYKGGVSWVGGTECCDSHFVAFTTNKKIDRLISARLSFTTVTWHKATSLSDIKYEKPQFHYVGLSYDDSVAVTVNGIVKHKYSWDRIQTAAEFVKNKDLPSDVKKNVADKAWVLNFYETEARDGAGVAEYTISWIFGLLMQWSGSGTNVSDVSLLALEFETDNVYYNLGVVDNMQSGGKTFTYKPKSDKTIEIILIILGVVAAVCLVALVIYAIAKKSKE